MAFFALAVYSQARVQAFGSQDIKRKAIKSNRFVVTDIDEPRRGQILSSDGKTLARDEGVFALHVNAEKVPKSPAFYLELGAAIEMSGSEIREVVSRSKGEIIWPATLTAEQKKKLDAVKSKWRADGLSADASGKRLYPLGSAASSIAGFLGNSETAKGIEKMLSMEIAGSEGISRGMIDRTGAFLPMRMEEDSTRRVDGSNVLLTVDSDLQQAAFDSVRRAVDANKAESGIAIVMDPKTGDVLAMANWPTFDPKTGQGPDGKPADFNPNIMGHFEPGSTMKILTQAKAIEDQVVGPGWTWNCNGTLTKGPYQIRCDEHHGSRAHGTVNLEKAISLSCNVSAAQWACLIKFEPYHQFIKDLGLVDALDVPLPNAKSGSLFIEPVAKTHELMCWGFGQSMGVTPLALASAFTSLGNDGIWMKPRFVKSIGGKEQPTQEGKAVFSPETTHQVMRYMEAVIDSDRGTGKSLRIPGYRMAGKTGTAERKGRKGGGYVANFVGFLPADNPRAMILVMIDRPSTGKYYGATVAGPVFSDLARAVIRKYGLKPTSGTTEAVKKPVAPKVEVEVRR
ncbi:MAG: penicillin-binding protein 2 [Chlorobia bacterium]|nr:penicillin-binding protein 2 [Fimbriimonadaceae bacterium]